jgi:hypothetical protein
VADFLALTNSVLRECGIAQDNLTIGGFTNPVDPIIDRIKQWVAQSYEDIQTARRDWEFMQATGVTRCSPKMEVYGAFASAGTVSAFVNVDFAVHASTNEIALTSTSLSATYSTDTLTDALVAAATAEGTLNFSYDVWDQPVLLEPGDLLTDASGDIYCYFQRWGRYDLSQSVTAGRNASTDIAELKLESLAVQDTSLATGQTYGSSSRQKLQYVSYGDWLRYAYDRPANAGKPTHFTLSNDGRVEFYPPLDDAYNISFEYTRTPQALSVHSDTPTYLPARFHNAIVWKAVMYWAEFTGDGQHYNRAKARSLKFDIDMIRDLLPPVKVTYDARQW